RRAWLRAGCVLLALAIYLTLWTAYALNGLTAYGRYRQLDAGAPAYAMGAEFRLAGLVQTTQLVNSITGDIVSPPANAAWVVARVDVVRQVETDFFLCTFEILGPDRRIWEPDTGSVSRGEPSTCDEESAPLGQTIQVEKIFPVPIRYVDELAGVVVADSTSRDVRQIMAPPA
ncbi:MAG: hypothetical protein L0H26_07530, partial [Microlunatus sp.]|nr:hypothetical protein [Microlunatus sp.]